MNNNAITNQKPILVCSIQWDGKRDIYAGHEIFLRVKKLMPETKIVFTVIKPKGFNEIDRVLSVFNKSVYEDLSKIQAHEGWEMAPAEEVLKRPTFFNVLLFTPPMRITGFHPKSYNVIPISLDYVSMG